MERLEHDMFAKHCNMSIEEIGEGYARVTMDADDRHLNSHETVHGGAIFSLADMAFAAASNSHGTLSVGVSCSIHYIKAAKKGRLVAEAIEDSKGTKLATYIVHITNEHNEKIATFQGMVYRKNITIS